MRIPRIVGIALLTMAMFVLVAVFSTGCGIIIWPPVPKPTPTPTPPPPGTVCEPETNCDCWVQPPGEEWKELKCAAAQICENHVCIEKPPIPPYSSCPKPLVAGAIVYMNNKAYGNGFDSTVLVKGDPEFCRLIHGVAINECHLEGWPTRAECEMELIGGCPTWQFIQTLSDPTPKICHDDQSAWASCDHFGNVQFRDDPKTTTVFEGQPIECGLQRDEFGPNAGFFTIAHGRGYVRACPPAGPIRNCGPWRPFDK